MRVELLMEYDMFVDANGIYMFFIHLYIYILV